MNLCGGIVNTTDADVLMPAVLATVSSADDGVLTFPRQKSSSRRRRSDGLKSSESTQRTSSSSRSRSRHSSSAQGLNPLSKEDLKKSRSRSRQRSRKASQPTSKINESAMVKKLESGLRLVSILGTDSGLF